MQLTLVADWSRNQAVLKVVLVGCAQRHMSEGPLRLKLRIPSLTHIV